MYILGQNIYSGGFKVDNKVKYKQTARKCFGDICESFGWFGTFYIWEKTFGMAIWFLAMFYAALLGESEQISLDSRTRRFFWISIQHFVDFCPLSPESDNIHWISFLFLYWIWAMIVFMEKSSHSLKDIAPGDFSCGEQNTINVILSYRHDIAVD